MVSAETRGAAASDYEAVGGGPAVSAVVDDFYARVLGDPALEPYFDGVDLPRLKRHQVMMVSQVLGGPVGYEGRSLADAHAGMGIGRGEFAAVVSHLADSLRSAGVPEEIIGRAGQAVAAAEPEVVESGASHA